MLLVDRPGLSVEIRFVLIGIQHLDLISVREEHTAVAAALAAAFDHRGRRPFNVQLAIAITILGRNAAGAIDGGYAIFDFPPRRTAVLLTYPARQILSIEQNDGIR